jgi:cyclopropane-fatty-acyl-phospholipid synthase
MSEARSHTAQTAMKTPPLGMHLLQRLMRRLERGRIVITLPDGTLVTHRGTQPGTEAWMELRNWRPLRAFLLGGDTALAQSYIAGDWRSPDLAAFLRWGAENMAPLDAATTGTWGAKLLARLQHWHNRNSRQGSRRNIMAHYDLGNSFYARWLDESMTYSSAIYAAPDEDLAIAQVRKLERIATLLQAELGANVLEIGCGWGALAVRLAQDGAHVTGLTLSPAQAEYARARLEEAGLDTRAEIALRDYRDETGVYDRVVSIEMLEAVGEAYWPTYFTALRARLKQGGRAVLQVITIAEERFDGYRRHPDFIQRHIFPGGMLPTKTAIAAQAAAAGLVLKSSEFFGQSYEFTLIEWRRRFLQAWPETQSVDGFVSSFRRLWDYYLAYCIAGFATGMTDVGFYVLEPAP